MANRNWIKGAVKRPGALRAKAKAAGGIDPKTGDIKKGFIDKAAKSHDTTTRKEAVLAKTFAKARKK